ncbi:MAG: hypothetical protein GC193_01890 [Cryomorphaceae bacterium]|nr:hypothetical protein [Cryomorphaceae bacterium]
MSVKICLFFSLLAILSSCKSQPVNNGGNTDEKGAQVAFGDTVNQLSDQLWYAFQDSRNNYWFGSNGEGVYCYDGQAILNFTTKHGLSNDTIRQIQEDKKGNMFFSTMQGVSKYDGQKFTDLQAIESTDWKLEDDDLWFFILGKSHEQGTYRYDGENLYHLQFPKHYLHEELMERVAGTFFSPYEVYSIYKDRTGAMWFGTSFFGACRFDGQSIKWMYENDLTITPHGGTFGIRSVFEDREGSFWICNTLNRYVFDFEKTQESDRLQYEKIKGIGNAELLDGEDYIYYSHILEDSEGSIWLTTWQLGVYKFDGVNITNYKVKDNGVDVNLVSMHKDKNGNLWLGTPNNGVFKFNGASFERFVP